MEGEVEGEKKGREGEGEKVGRRRGKEGERERERRKWEVKEGEKG